MHNMKGISNAMRNTGSTIDDPISYTSILGALTICAYEFAARDLSGRKINCGESTMHVLQVH